jgi:hypothetical protein
LKYLLKNKTPIKTKKYCCAERYKSDRGKGNERKKIREVVQTYAEYFSAKSNEVNFREKLRKSAKILFLSK